MHKIIVIRKFQEYVMIIERGRRWNMATRVTETVPFCGLRVLQVMLWNSILFHLGMQCHPQPGVYSGRWLHHRTEDPAVPPECRGATELGRTESPHCTSSAGEAGSEGQGHYWRGMSLDVLWNHSYSWGRMFSDCQHFAGLWGRYFVANWFVALQCKMIYYFVKHSWGL